MAAAKEYCEKLSSGELNGALWSYCYGAIGLDESMVTLILEILENRGELNQSTAALVEERRKEIKENGPGIQKPIIKLGPHPITFQYTEEP